jgi:hypothetical protein
MQLPARRAFRVGGLAVRSLSLLLALAGGAFPARLRAQGWSDPVPQTRVTSSQETIESEIEKGRYRLGPVWVFPKLSLSNAGYNSNIFGTSDPVGDGVAEAVAGARFLLPAGKKIYLQANVLPQYTWYATQTDLRHLGGVYGGTFFAFFNHLSVEASGGYSDLSAIPTSETSAPSIQQLTWGSTTLSLDVTRFVALLGGASIRTTRYSALAGSPLTPETLADQDRTDRSFYGGVRFSRLGPFTVNLIAVDNQAIFVRQATERDNQSLSFLVNVLLNTTKFFINATAGYRQGRPFNGSLLPPYDTPVFSAFTSWMALSFLELQAWGYRNVSYSLNSTYPYFYESRYGGGPVVRLNPRMRVQAYASQGKNDYPATVSGNPLPPQPAATQTNYGGTVSVLISKAIVLNLGAAVEQYRSPVPDQNRRVVRLLTGLSFEGFPTP